MISSLNDIFNVQAQSQLPQNRTSNNSTNSSSTSTTFIEYVSTSTSTSPTTTTTIPPSDDDSSKDVATAIGISLGLLGALAWFGVAFFFHRLAKKEEQQRERQREQEEERVALEEETDEGARGDFVAFNDNEAGTGDDTAPPVAKYDFQSFEVPMKGSEYKNSEEMS